jgi:hypothetical protein
MEKLINFKDAALKALPKIAAVVVPAAVLALVVKIFDLDIKLTVELNGDDDDEAEDD